MNDDSRNWDVSIEMMDSVLPDGWQELPLSSLADIRFSNVDKRSYYGESPVLLCNYLDVYNNDYITAKIDFMAATANGSEISRFSVQPGDVMITKDSETPDDIGIPAVLTSPIPNLVCGYHLAQIRPIPSRLNSVFLAKQLGHHRVATLFGRWANGSTRYGLSSASIANLLVRVPPLPQQSKIAKILTTLDNLIEKTEALIAKYQAVRLGMMHDLITRGVDEQGHLRPPQAEAPHLYEPSPLGLIPNDWGYCRVDKVGSVKLGRQRSPQHQTGRFTTSYLRVANVFDGWIDYSDVLEMDFTPSERETFSLLPGDILLNEGQSIELVGRSATYDGEPGVYCFQNTLIRFRTTPPDEFGYCQAVFKYWLDTGRFMTVARQTTSVAHLGADRLARMDFPRPKPEEQKRIVAALSSFIQRVRAEELHQSKLLKLKSGLMQDLLEGKVQVRDDPETCAVEVASS